MKNILLASLIALLGIGVLGTIVYTIISFPKVSIYFIVSLVFLMIFIDAHQILKRKL